MNQEGRVMTGLPIGGTDIILSKITLPKFPDYSYRKIGRRAWTGPDSSSVSEGSISRWTKGNKGPSNEWVEGSNNKQLEETQTKRLEITQTKRLKTEEMLVSNLYIYMYVSVLKPPVLILGTGDRYLDNDRTRNKQIKASEDLQTKRLETEEFFSMFMSFHLLISVFKPPVLILGTGDRYLDNDRTRNEQNKRLESLQEKRLETEKLPMLFMMYPLSISVFKPPVLILGTGDRYLDNEMTRDKSMDLQTKRLETEVSFVSLRVICISQSLSPRFNF